MNNNFRVTLGSLVILCSSLFFTGHVNAFGFGDLIKQAIEPQAEAESHSPSTPIEKFIEAIKAIENSHYTVPITAEDSIAFRGFSVINVNGKFKAFTNSNMDGEVHVVIFPILYTNQPRKMYIKKDGQWSIADENTFVSYINSVMLPAMNTNYLVKAGGNETPKVLVVLGSQCPRSQHMEEFLNINKIPHFIMPALSDGDTINSLVAMSCGDSTQWSNWSVGKPAKFNACNEKGKYSVFYTQANPILDSLYGLTNQAKLYPAIVLPNGEASDGWKNNDPVSKTLFLNRLNASQDATTGWLRKAQSQSDSTKSNGR
jgi:hypothetical protein